MLIGNILLAIVSITTVISYLPQILKILKTRSSEDISIASCIIWLIGAISYLLYAIFFGYDLMLIITTGIEAALCLTLFIFVIKYYKNQPTTKKRRRR